MLYSKTKYKKSEKYKNVYFTKGTYGNFRDMWYARISVKGNTYTKICKTEREAAIAVDEILLKQNRKPKNILKPKL